jgi:hypothetical protein
MTSRPASCPPGPTGEVFVKAVEEEPTAADWSVVAFALCANAS